MAIELKNVGPLLQTHNVVPSEKNTISILIGNGQLGSSWIQDENGTELAKGTITNFALPGTGSDWIGKTIIVFTNVLDVNTQDPNNLAIVTHRYKNPSKSYRFEESAPNGGVISFEVRYTFNEMI